MGKSTAHTMSFLKEASDIFSRSNNVVKINAKYERVKNKFSVESKYDPNIDERRKLMGECLTIVILSLK